MIDLRRSMTLMLVWSLLSMGAGKANASTPTEEIRATLERVRTVLTEPSSGGESARRASLRTVLSPHFDFAEMARRSLGTHWNHQEPRQEEFVALFTDFIESAYVGKILSLKEEKIVFVGESVEKDIAQVDTKLVPANGAEPTAVNYLLHLVEGKWKVYDVVVENISLVGNYRSQFHRIIKRESFDELLNRLKAKVHYNGG